MELHNLTSKSEWISKNFNVDSIIVELICICGIVISSDENIQF